MDRKEIIQNLRDRRYSYQEIGNYLGISRQRIHQILTGYKSPANYPKPDTEIPPKWKPSGEYNSKGLWKEGFEGRDYLKELVRRRDNHTCQICGKIWEKGKRRFDVHHLDKKLEGENGSPYQSCKNLDKQITLCHKCHLNLEHIKKKFSTG